MSLQKDCQGYDDRARASTPGVVPENGAGLEQVHKFQDGDRVIARPSFLPGDDKRTQRLAFSGVLLAAAWHPFKQNEACRNRACGGETQCNLWDRVFCGLRRLCASCLSAVVKSSSCTTEPLTNCDVLECGLSHHLLQSQQCCS